MLKLTLSAFSLLFMMWIVMSCTSQNAESGGSDGDEDVDGVDGDLDESDDDEAGDGDPIESDLEDEQEVVLTPEQWILRAGNSEDEKERYRLLERVLSMLDPESDLALELAGLLPVIDQWANGLEKYWVPGDTERSAEDGYLCGFSPPRPGPVSAMSMPIPFPNASSPTPSCIRYGAFIADAC